MQLEETVKTEKIDSIFFFLNIIKHITTYLDKFCSGLSFQNYETIKFVKNVHAKYI